MIENVQCRTSDVVVVHQSYILACDDTNEKKQQFYSQFVASKRTLEIMFIRTLNSYVGEQNIVQSSNF